jgi:glycosyltransferase involved in cell wall biosynthesis
MGGEFMWSGAFRRKLRILFIVPYVPSLIRVRSFNLIKHLSQLGHAITVLTIWTTGREREEIKKLKEYCHRVEAVRLSGWRSLWNCLGALPTPLPLQAVYCRSESLERLISQFATHHSHDVVHVEHLRGAIYGLGIKGVPVVWDSVDCISLLFEQTLRKGPGVGSRLKAWIDLGRTKRYEGWLIGQFDRVLVTSPMDKEALLATRNSPIRSSGRNEDPRSRGGSHGNFPEDARESVTSPIITILPNGVDLEYFKPRDRHREPRTLVFTGKMSYHANVAAALHLLDNIMPLVWNEKPYVKLYIVGKDPPRSVRARGDDPRINVTGYVPDIRPYLGRATVAVAPLVYGAGTQFKVLEAMAMETPVVTTSLGSQGLGVTENENIIIADEPPEFARWVLRLLEDESLRRRIGEGGKRYVEENHDWRAVVRKLEGIYREVIG